jgi:asparagine synthase (glutamine-hydrolysing)
MSGAGGDEFFGGYNRYQGLALQGRLNAAVPDFAQGAASVTLSGLAAMIGRHRRRGDLIARFAREIGKPLDIAYLHYITSMSREERSALLEPSDGTQVDPALTEDLILRHLRAFEGPDRVQAAMYADTQTYLPEDVLALSDRLGMWHSLEIRVPLADKDVAVAAFSLPSSAHVSARAKKISLKRAVGEWLPDSILTHPKQGFESPTAAWLRGSGQSEFRQLLEDSRDCWQEYVRPAAVDALLEQHGSGRADRAKTLFAVLAFVTWARQRHAR